MVVFLVQQVRMCQNISLISDEAKGCRNWKEFKKVQTDVREMTKELKSLQDNKEKNIKFLEKDEKKMLTDIKSLRKKNNDMFDTVEKGMIQEMDSKLKEHGDALQEDKSRCKTQYDKLETYLKNMESNQVNTSAYMAYKKCKDEMKGAENLLKEMSANPDVKLAFQADPGIEEPAIPKKDQLLKYMDPLVPEICCLYGKRSVLPYERIA
ncbi:hypothetical protein MAR_011367 [Mya arenaria]|uniref:Uncharacterized protein n=1 Tax=Mya arenaria TaxID=6604 RepID=A0ABY7FTX9_MYAAR|nr:hypothetical protein MAR_011367 [Mya arenaria]